MCNQQHGDVNRVTRWMKRVIGEYIDMYDAVDCTKLAEDAADEFNLYEDDDDATIPEWVFEIASELSTEYANSVEDDIENYDEEDSEESYSEEEPWCPSCKQWPHSADCMQPHGPRMPREKE